MKPRLISVLILVWGWTSCFAQVSPKFERDSIPVPPAQNQPWKPPLTTLPTVVVSSCQDLFDAGLSDPRGCEYREIVVPFRAQSRWSPADDADAFKTHGWVLPAQAGDAQRYAVCWNGLVYPLVSLGAPADLDGDIQKVLAQNVDPDSTGMRRDPSTPSPGESLAFDQFTLIKLPLLLRLGRVDLAEGVWNLLQAWIKASRWNEDDLKQADPFMILSHEWLRSTLDHALDAHVRDDASLALACLQPMPEMRKRVEQATARRMVVLAKTNQDYQPSRRLFDLTFLNQVPVLIEEERRRIKENVTNRDEEFAPKNIADKKQRIALLIRDLEDVEAYQIMMPGYVTFGMSPVVENLVNEGEDAVDPLLDCLEHDRRLTRSVDAGVRIIGVEEPAFAALQGILKTQNQFAALQEPYVNYGPGEPRLGRMALAAQIRAYWDRVRGRTQPERWYGILLDDRANPDAWAEAAGNIVLPDDAELFAGNGVMMMSHPSGAPVRFWGEALRGKANPSVSDLLIKRLKESLAAKDTRPFFPLEAPKKLAAALAKWDGKNQIETLRWYGVELQKIILTETDSNGPGEIDDLIKTYLERVEAGDAQALSDYAQWIRAADASKLDKLAHLYGATFFSPVWSYPNDPVIVALTKWLFEDSSSPWSIGPSGIDPTWVATSTHLPLVAVPAFRALLLQQLQNQQIAGKVETTAPNNIMVTFVYGSGYQNTDPDAPPAGMKQDLRLCDIIAFKISQMRGAPRCEPYWTKDRRDGAIQETISFLRQYGDRLAHQSTSQEDEHLFSSFDTPLRFPPLDHPATLDDVAAGRAIFSMEGKGDRKVWPLPETPLQAQWMTLKAYPTTMASGVVPVANWFTKTKGYDQNGTIWQAEEVTVDGKSQRYFGFVGKNCLAAAPGNEVQFELGDYYEPIDGWGFRIDMTGSEDPRGVTKRLTAKVGDAIPIRVWVKNLQGNDRALSLFQHAPGLVSAGNVGLEIQLDYCPRPMNSILTFPPPPNVKWVPVTAKLPLQVNLWPIPAALVTLAGTSLLDFDLAKFYDLKLAGSYRMTFTQLGTLDLTRNISPQYFELTE